MRIRLYCSEDGSHHEDMQFRALVATNAADIGIDKNTILLQLCFEWPRDLPINFQERGCGSCIPGSYSRVVFYADLSLFVYLMAFVMLVEDSDDIEPAAIEEIHGFNSALSPLRQSQGNITNNTHPIRVNESL